MNKKEEKSTKIDWSIDTTLQNFDKLVTWIEEQVIELEKKYSAHTTEKKHIKENKINRSNLEEWLLQDFSEITDTIIKLRLSTISTDLIYYICEKNKQITHAYKWLTTYFPLELFRIYSKNIASEMDKDYSDSIYNTTEVWITHNLTGVPHKVIRKNISEDNWDLLLANHACFRTELDLLTSHYMLKDLKKKVFKTTT